MESRESSRGSVGRATDPRQVEEGASTGAGDWLDYWYPVTFSNLLRDDAPMPLTLLDQPLVLYRDAQGRANCVADRCPHRSTPLSLGRMVDGRLECPYHGWQFAGEGRCEKIPTLAQGEPIARAAHATAHATAELQGVVWLWLGDPAKADPSQIRHDPEIDAPGFRGTVRHSRQPLGPPQGFRFDAPCTVRLDLVSRPGWDFIQIQHCVPLGLRKPRMRLMSRMVRNWLTWITWVPGMTWLAHRSSRRILDQDTAMLTGQQQRLAGGARPWNCPVGADRLAVEYRRWRERMPAGSEPFART